MAEEKEAKLKALDIALNQIERDYGKGAVMKLGEGPIAKIDSISTGSISLDWALGIGGIPQGQNYRDFWSRVFRQDDPMLKCDCRSPKTRWNRSIH